MAYRRDTRIWRHPRIHIRSDAQPCPLLTTDIQGHTHLRRLDTDLSRVVAPLEAMLTAASTAWEAARSLALRATSSSVLAPGSWPLWCACSKGDMASRQDVVEGVYGSMHGSQQCCYA